MNNDNKRSTGGLGLVGDIGSTNARFALWRGQRLRSIEVLACADHPQPELAVRDYLAQIDESVANIDLACPACAGPIGATDLRFTNNHWVISRAAFREELGLGHLLLVDDLNIMAWAASRPGVDELVRVRAGNIQVDRARLIIGPDTGLGVGGLLPLDGGRWEVLPCEGGYVNLSVTSPHGFALWQGLQACYGHASAERVPPGNDLFAPYEISCVLDGVTIRVSSTAEIGVLAMAGDVQANAVLEHFFL